MEWHGALLWRSGLVACRVSKNVAAVAPCSLLAPVELLTTNNEPWCTTTLKITFPFLDV